jgi:hypothetical protein
LIFSFYSIDDPIKSKISVINKGYKSVEKPSSPQRKMAYLSRRSFLDMRCDIELAKADYLGHKDKKEMKETLRE